MADLSVDTSIPEFGILLENSYLLSWFTINKDMNHPKLYSIPIGIVKSLPYVYNCSNTNIYEHD